MTEIIAEVANSHQGKFSNAKKIISRFKNLGTSSIKFQIYFADDFLSVTHKRFKHFKKQAFNKSELNLLVRHARKCGFKNIYADILGSKAFSVAKSLKLDGYKIHSTDLMNLDLVHNVGKEKKKVFLSTGGAKDQEIFNAVKILSNFHIRPILMHGFQSYPTKINETNLDNIKYLKSLFGDNCQYGFQDHIAGSSKYNLYVSLFALGYGIQFLEKHITLDRKKKGIDYYSSLEPKEFKNFCYIIKNTLNASSQKFTHSEEIYRKSTKKFWITNKKIKKGSIVKLRDIHFKRINNNSIEPLFLSEILNKKVIKSIKKNEVIKNSYFKKKVVASIVARSDSKRLPGKALIKVGKYTLLEYLFIRLKNVKFFDDMVFCTTLNKSDNKLCKLAQKHNIKYFRGQNYNVLDRIVSATRKLKADIVIRITGDDIFTDIDYLQKAIEYHLINNLDYTDHKDLPGGTETEIINFKILNLINKYALDASNTEYLTYYINKNKRYFRVGSAEVLKKHKKHKFSLSIDNQNDLNFVKPFLETLDKENKIKNYNIEDLIKYFKNKTKKKINKKDLKINTLLDKKICQELN